MFGWLSVRVGRPHAPRAAAERQQAKPSHSCSAGGGRTAWGIHRLSAGDENHLMHGICLLLTHAGIQRAETSPASPTAPQRVREQLGQELPQARRAGSQAQATVGMLL